MVVCFCCCHSAAGCLPSNTAVVSERQEVNSLSVSPRPSTSIINQRLQHLILTQGFGNKRLMKITLVGIIGIIGIIALVGIPWRIFFILPVAFLWRSKGDSSVFHVRIDIGSVFVTLSQRHCNGIWYSYIPGGQARGGLMVWEPGDDHTHNRHGIRENNTVNVLKTFGIRFSMVFNWRLWEDTVLYSVLLDLTDILDLVCFWLQHQIFKHFDLRLQTWI